MTVERAAAPGTLRPGPLLFALLERWHAVDAERVERGTATPEGQLLAVAAHEVTWLALARVIAGKGSSPLEVFLREALRDELADEWARFHLVAQIQRAVHESTATEEPGWTFSEATVQMARASLQQSTLASFLDAYSELVVRLLSWATMSAWARGGIDVPRFENWLEPAFDSLAGADVRELAASAEFAAPLALLDAVWALALGEELFQELI